MLLKIKISTNDDVVLNYMKRVSNHLSVSRRMHFHVSTSPGASTTIIDKTLTILESKCYDSLLTTYPGSGGVACLDQRSPHIDEILHILIDTSILDVITYYQINLSCSVLRSKKSSCVRYHLLSNQLIIFSALDLVTLCYHAWKCDGNLSNISFIMDFTNSTISFLNSNHCGCGCCKLFQISFSGGCDKQFQFPQLYHLLQIPNISQGLPHHAEEAEMVVAAVAAIPNLSANNKLQTTAEEAEMAVVKHSFSSITVVVVVVVVVVVLVW